MAERVLATQGLGAWPTCGTRGGSARPCGARPVWPPDAMWCASAACSARRPASAVLHAAQPAGGFRPIHAEPVAAARTAPLVAARVGSTNADRDATAARCRVSTASGTRTEARLAAALRNAGRRLTIRPISADSRTSARTRRRRNAANRANAVARSSALVDEVGQYRGVLQPLTAALAQVRPHRVGGVAHDQHRPARPNAAPDRGRRGRCARRPSGSVAARTAGIGSAQEANVVRRYASSPSGATPSLRRPFGGEPVGAVRPERNVAELDGRAQDFAGEFGVDRTVGHPAPCRVADVAVRQCAVEVAGHHRTGAVRADDGGRLARRRVRQRDPHAGRRWRRVRGRRPRFERCRQPARRPGCRSARSGAPPPVVRPGPSRSAPARGGAATSRHASAARPR